METHPCHYCHGTGFQPFGRRGVECEECEGTGLLDCMVFDNAAEMLEWLGTDVED